LRFERIQILAQMPGIGIGELGAFGRQEGGIGLEVAFIGGERVGGGTALGTHHFEEALDQAGLARSGFWTIAA